MKAYTSALGPAARLTVWKVLGISLLAAGVQVLLFLTAPNNSGTFSLESTVQAGKLSEIATGVDQISNVVQTNSATAEQSAAASQELSGQASTMHQQVLQFKLEDAAPLGQFSRGGSAPEGTELNQ